MSRRRLPPAPCIAYGDHPDQVANLHLPAREGGPWPCVVLLHGGFWRTGWDRTLMTPLAADLARRGIAAWNVEYRRVGQEGGGWPGTFEDVAAAVDRLAEIEEVDAGRRVATCGHSAGGHLALWLAGRHRLPAGAIGNGPRVRPRRGDRAGRRVRPRAAHGGTTWGAPRSKGCWARFAAKADRYATTSPAALAPLGVPQLLVHGTDDDVVPISQSRDHAALDPRAELVELEGADHFDVVDVEHAAWRAVTDRLPMLLPS